MLLLLPPSEGKTAPPPGAPPADLDELAFAGVLGTLRGRVLRAVDKRLATAPAAPAAEVYTGVLFERLGLGSLGARARRRAEQHVLVTSGLWGVVRPQDRIPAYKLPVGTKVPRLGGLPRHWRPLLAEALADLDQGLVVDCRSGPYAALWRPKEAQRVEVRAFRIRDDGSRQVISHMAKASRGLVAREVLRAPRLARTPQDVAEAAAAAGLEVELRPPDADRAPWALDVLEH